MYGHALRRVLEPAYSEPESASTEVAISEQEFAVQLLAQRRSTISFCPAELGLKNPCSVTQTVFALAPAGTVTNASSNTVAPSNVVISVLMVWGVEVGFVAVILPKITKFPVLGTRNCTTTVNALGTKGMPVAVLRYAVTVMTSLLRRDLSLRFRNHYHAF
jgi:hypothetical protein